LVAAVVSAVYLAIYGFFVTEEVARDPEHERLRNEGSFFAMQRRSRRLFLDKLSSGDPYALTAIGILLLWVTFLLSGGIS
jgi:hypothetical protein